MLALVLLFSAAGVAPSATLAPPPPTTAVRLDGLPEAQAGARGSAAAQGATTASTAVRAEIPFSMLGFEAPEGARLEVRVSLDGQEWGSWIEADPLEPDEGPDRASAEARQAAASAAGVATDPIWVGQARWLQVRVAGARPSEVTAHVIDSMGLSRSLLGRATDAVAAAWRGGAAVAHAQTGAPPIVSRAQWGADESWRSQSPPSVARRVRLGVVHHTATSNDYTPAEASGVVRAIYRYHTRSLGWRDIGYNLLVDRYGTVYEGRFGGLEQGVIGAHAGGFNTGSFGIAVIGDFTGTAPPAPALEALARTMAWKFDVHHLDVTGAWDYTSFGSTRYPRGTVVRVPTVIGHRDVSATSCPGNAFYALLPDLRHRILELGSHMFLDHGASPGQVTLIRDLADPVEFSTGLRPAGGWRLRVTDPSGLVVHSDGGSGQLAKSRWAPAGLSGPGTYTYTFTSQGRRPATDVVEFVLPVIRNAAAEPSTGMARDDGTLASPIAFSAELWRGASWELEVRGPSGTVVHHDEGRGERLATEWRQAEGKGVHTWTMSADNAEPSTGTVPVLLDVLDRLAGSDTVGGAVTIAQEAFPESRSAGHAVLARADVFADALAAGPLAGADGPVLLTGGDRLDDRVRAELARVLRPGGTVYVLGGAAAIAPQALDGLEPRWEVTRLAGAGRVETAARVAEEVVGRSGETTALVARAGPDDAAPWADALSGGVYGAARGYPVLLTDRDELPAATARALRRMGITETVVLGGTAAVSPEVLERLPGGRRVSGPDRAATAAAVAAELWGRTAGASSDRVILAGGYRDDAWALALAASPLGARHEAPLLLADAGALPPATRDYLSSLGYGSGGPARGWVVGDTSAVSTAVAHAAAATLQQ